MKRAQLISLVLVLAAGGCAPASSGGAASGGPGGGKGDTGGPAGNFETFEHKWAIDLKKVKEVRTYGNVTRFFGLSARQLIGDTCPEPTQATQIQLQLEQVAEQAAIAEQDPAQAVQQAMLAMTGGDEQAMQGLVTCLAASQPERVIDPETNQVVGVGGGYAFGNFQTRKADHTPYVDSEEEPLINLVDYDETGNPTYIDPPGYLNLIALHTAEREEQPELDRYLKNGDILVYVHPEDDDQHVQFAAHHAAMYYHTGKGPGLAISLTGERPYVHHIDNPTSYGPAFNAGKASTPFHVFRFNPNGAPNTENRDGEGFYRFPCNDSAETLVGCEDGTFEITDEMAERYAWVARNWAFMNNVNAPFADFQTLNLKRLEDLEDGFAAPAIQQMSMEPTYCAGLVFTNLALGTNFPLNEHGLGDLWDDFAGQEYPFRDGYLDATFAAQDLVDPYAAKGTQPLPKLGVLPIEPILPSDILMNWVERYFPGAGMPEEQIRKIRAGVMASPQMKEMLVRRFSVLDWDTDSAKLDAWRAENGEENDNGTRTSLPPVVTEETVEMYAGAYALGGRPAVEALQHGPCANPGVRAMLGESRASCPERSEAASVEQRYMYPPIYHVEANREGSMISYVGTVVHHELLTPIYGHDGGADSGEVKEFFQGGPDSSQYPHYFVPDGLSHTQRVFQMDSGPKSVGHGTTVSARISAADWKDVRVLLHPPVTFENRGGPLESRFECEQDMNCLCPAEKADCMTNPDADSWYDKPIAIMLPINKHVRDLRVKGQTAGVSLDRYEATRESRAGWRDGQVTWNLFDGFVPNDERFNPERNGYTGASCRKVDIDGESLPMCPRYAWPAEPEEAEIATCTRQGEWLDPYTYCADGIPMVDVSDAHGQWTMTVVDRGHHTRDAWGEIPYCVSCNEGGAHSNQWVLKVRDDEARR